MMYLTPLPPELYEVLNCALATSDFVTLGICIRYLMTAYFQFRKALTPWQSLRAMRTLRLSIGFTVFLIGETPRMGYLWFVRYLANTGHDATWLSKGWWIFLPVAASAVAVFGMACVVRALIPEVWGRYGYVGTIAISVVAVIGTQLFR